ncbi:MAG: hydroxymethylbilane synthase [Dehalococcoidia bacterium]
MKKQIIIGTRGSKLALLQAESVSDRLVSLYPGYQFEIATVSTTGDRNTDVSLEQLGGQGVFVKELEEALLHGDIDIAVHSLKDMLTIIPEALCLAAVPERVDPRDAIISPFGGLRDVPYGARVGTGSPRRGIQIRAMRPDIEISELRGNIDTRIKKAFLGELDGIVIAAAALIRLGLEEKITEYLPEDAMVPAVGQGALGIETRSSDEDLVALVSKVNHEPTWRAVSAERAFLREMGGGCRAPIAALGSIDGRTLRLRGIASSPDGSEMLREEIKGSAERAEEVGKEMARIMLKAGAASFVERGPGR